MKTKQIIVKYPKESLFEGQDIDQEYLYKNEGIDLSQVGEYDAQYDEEKEEMAISVMNPEIENPDEEQYIEVPEDNENIEIIR